MTTFKSPVSAQADCPRPGSSENEPPDASIADHNSPQSGKIAHGRTVSDSSQNAYWEKTTFSLFWKMRQRVLPGGHLLRHLQSAHPLAFPERPLFGAPWSAGAAVGALNGPSANHHLPQTPERDTWPVDFTADELWA